MLQPKRPNSNPRSGRGADETVDADAELLWFDEIRRRDAEIRVGTAKLKPAEQVLREARELLK
jgi:hypothetical protein